jgi:tyrosine aminotransferase
VVAEGADDGHGSVVRVCAEAKRAVAQKFNTTESPLRESDIILTSGCSGALEIAIKAFCNPGDNILLPRPGFSLYQTICEHLDVKWKHYNLLVSWCCCRACPPSAVRH